MRLLGLTKLATLKSYVGDSTSKRLKHFTLVRNNKVKDFIQNAQSFLITGIPNLLAAHLALNLATSLRYFIYSVIL